MKLRIIGIILLFLFAYGCSGNQTGLHSITSTTKTTSTGNTTGNNISSISLNRVMSQTDPNKNPNWDWTTMNPISLYLFGVSRTVSLSKPYYNNESGIFNFCGSDFPDIQKKDGWVLVARDFGTTNQHVSLPFFLLYNKYRGILRLFVFANWQEMPAGLQYTTVTLQEVNAQHQVVKTPYFTLTHEFDGYLGNQSTTRQNTIGVSLNSYFFMSDFYLGGYDPNISNKSREFKISIYADKSFSITPQNGISKQALIGSNQSGSTHSGVVQAQSQNVDTFYSLSKEFSTVTATKREFTNLLASKNSGPQWWLSSAQNIDQLNGYKWISALGPLTGALHFLMGGGSTIKDQPLPLTTIEHSSLTGTEVKGNPVGVLYFSVPGSKNAQLDSQHDFSYVSFYNQPPGIFSITDKPSVTLDASGTFTGSGCRKTITFSNRFIPESNTGTDCSFEGKITYHAEINTVYNAHIFSNESLSMAMERNGEPIENYHPVSSSGEVSFTSDFNNYLSYEKTLSRWRSHQGKIALKVLLQPQNAAANMTPVTIYKEITPSFDINNQGLSLK